MYFNFSVSFYEKKTLMIFIYLNKTNARVCCLQKVYIIPINTILYRNKLSDKTIWHNLYRIEAYYKILSYQHR